ncbi:FG-GAP-like repeat-containing protein [Jiangella rhizosphaerae]|uniref:FG-GAP-like repeat-containing protein n=1 Tax=Jiangella rhizosphaerae TaxID=2293569 RepID=UPI0011C4038B|nr:FG-GAP-like repeat-containing protein [Jiangella rhizosphaerae]
MDWDGDAIRDVVDGGLLFRNSGTEETPVLGATGVSLPVPEPEGVLVDWDADGDHDYLGRYTLRLYRNLGSDTAPDWQNEGELLAGDDPITATFAEFNRWNLNHSPSLAYDDWDADGDRDLLIGAADRVVDGSSTIVYTEGAIVLFENVGTETAPTLATGRAISTAAGELNAPFKPMIATADWNGDGQLDVLYGDYRGDVWFAERDGAEVLPPVRILDTGDIGAWLDVADRDGDGDLDLIVTSTYGALLVENTGTVSSAILEEAGVIRMEAAGADIRVGLFESPYVVDWDGDDDHDLVVGDENGRVSVFENVSSGPVPELIDAVPVLAGGRPLNLDADDAAGSWEWGASEAAAGYTNPVVVDWDDDGDLDIITQDAQEATLWYFENAGTRTAPRYREAEAFTLGGQPFTNAWRCRVAVLDWDDDGDLDLVQAGEDNVLNVYTRDGGDLSLAVLGVAQDSAGRPVSIPSSRAGRTNLQSVDWDGDGLTDLIQAGYGSTALIWLRNVGSPGAPVFEIDYVRNADRTLYESVSNHTPKTFAVDWDHDGHLDLIDTVVWGSIMLVDGAGLAHEPVERALRRFEAEDLPVTASSGDASEIFTNPVASGGGVLHYQANAVGDHVVLGAEVPASGSYRVIAGMRVAPNRAIVQASVDGTPVGDPVDAYSPTPGYQEFDLGVATITGLHTHEIGFTVTGRNPASSTYAVYLDHIELVPVGEHLEAEVLPRASTSGDRLGVFVDAAASGGATANFQANGVGDDIDYLVDVPEAGRYDIQLGMRVARNRGIVQVSIDGVAVGDPIDPSRAAAGNVAFPVGTHTFTAAGTHRLRLEVVGRNPASTSFAVYPDYVSLLRPGHDHTVGPGGGHPADGDAR